ncbi:pectinesterase [Streptosporangium becharense]|uniref:Pectinesterase n=1 Tax=Streptosporangium becharense TaxID=1816182 RepID=A0A7W9IKD3_9ACTN|nr:pectinesterase family protein [Streptosporangium becharense]MBB2911263.1 pectinesterase [Streptosporangium becharense]MBB5821679.1 pectinesterase [Streptosporangium becharense]
MSPQSPLFGRRQVLAGAATTALGLALVPATGAAAGAAAGTAHRRPFGRYGSPLRRLNERTLYVDAQGRGDHTTVQAAVTATPDAPEQGWTLVIAAGTYRETVLVPQAKTGLTFVGATRDARDVVIVFDNAAGTPKPGGGTYGTSGSATTTVQADGFTASHVTFANDWLRADHPEITGTQAVAAKIMGDRSAFWSCRFLGHQDTLYADTRALTSFARQYYRDCHIEGDVDFVFGRATAVFDRCELRALPRDVTFRPYGYVFAPSTAGANPHGYLASRCRVTGDVPDGSYGLARPWRPSSDPTAVPMLTVRETRIGPAIDTAAPYVNMSSGYPWQEARFGEYRNSGPGAAIPVPENRPQLTAEQAAERTVRTHLGDWTPSPAGTHPFG